MPYDINGNWVSLYSGSGSTLTQITDNTGEDKSLLKKKMGFDFTAITAKKKPQRPKKK